ncbi:MAG: O-acetylhomoserine aminocarboxypropyltransferase/cysteine synthase [Desulfobacteraceae bacterium]|nr:O-acetylhomoserine aminocarboxypropyltransferase/cysteine synthase [Desulfobacteraceae bacterium]
MRKENDLHFDSRVIHEALTPEEWHGSTMPPIFQSASTVHNTAQSLSDTFAGKQKSHIYMRLTNPTNSVFEEKITSLENGKGAIAMSSGMAAITNTCMALLRSGDEFISSSSLFMSTYLLFTGVFKKYNLNAKIIDIKNSKILENSITDKTRFIYVETIGNPKMDIPDIKKIAKIADAHGLPLVVDNTLASPYLARPIDLGANVVIHSTTKYLSGHGAATGGIVIDGGNFKWENNKRFPDFVPFIERKGELALLDKIWREHHINFGTTQAPFHSYLAMIGMDTLALRMERHMSNAVKVAKHLESHKKVKWVNFPGLPDHPDHETANKVFCNQGFGAMIGFGLENQEQCFTLIDNLNMIYHLANLGDCKTLIIHPWSSQYISFDPEVKTGLSITPDLIRLSVGIENPDDIINDIDQALDKI